MDNSKLSQYFSDTETKPDATQFFDEISTSNTDINLVEEPTVLLAQKSDTTVLKKESLPTAFSMPVNSLPDPSTFFDNIGCNQQIGGSRSIFSNQNIEVNTKDNPGQSDPELDRRRDAWIPNDEARRLLAKAQNSPAGSFFPDRDCLTMPGLFLGQELPDSLQESALKYIGISEVSCRNTPRLDHVSKDESGLRELIRTGYLRAAINLTATLLSAYGQGVGRSGHVTKHTSRSLQVWLTRLSLLVRVEMYQLLKQETTAFGDLNKPDMFYQFYPESYGNRPGSLVPFSLRLLIAEAPMYWDNTEESIQRLYSMLAVIRKMLGNLAKGLSEDGSVEIKPSDRDDSITLWRCREVRVMHSIINCALAIKDYRLASQLLITLADREPITLLHKRNILSALARVYIQAGHLTLASVYLEKCKELRTESCPMPDVREYVDMSLLEMAKGNYQIAYNYLISASQQDPTNVMVANNTAITLLYMGKVKEAINVLQITIQNDPERSLNESLILNLCTLYELESCKTNVNKINLLKLLCKYKTDSMANVLQCLKLS